jgi:hypothetical protein
MNEIDGLSKKIGSRKNLLLEEKWENFRDAVFLPSQPIGFLSSPKNASKHPL